MSHRLRYPNVALLTRQTFTFHVRAGLFPIGGGWQVQTLRQPPRILSDSGRRLQLKLLVLVD